MATRTPSSATVTEDRLRTGLQTFVAAASAWVYRDGVQTKSDAEQERNLHAVLVALEALANRQRKILKDVIRSTWVDHLVIAIKDHALVASGGARKAVANANHKGRAKHSAGGSVVEHPLPGKLSPNWYVHEYFFLDQDPLVTALRLGYWNYTVITDGAGQWLDLERARQLSATAQQLLRTNATRRASKYRSYEVAAVLLRDLLDSKGSAASLLARAETHAHAAIQAAGQAAVRRLRQRHPDRGGDVDLNADGNYFGAHRPDPSQIGRTNFPVCPEPVTAAAIEFLADCLGADDAAKQCLAGVLGAQQDVWMAAAKGGK